ncbi:sugar transferase [Geomonas sp. Red32]|uniref:sugar transferase n=1 Tax=Geomonas sp. Red32 TaxID=2912856 RepID=UPI00202CC453|nr:sugar transferase [Geomonas sp. Red32]MCM0082871.1 sugar transferase [Geomonas sp. Red32]
MEHGLYPIQFFRERLIQERRRAERSQRPLLVMVLDAERLALVEGEEHVTDTLGDGVHTVLRGTDICGVLKEGALVGVILTEIEPEKVEAAKRIVTHKTRESLASLLSADLANRVVISFRVYPGPGGGDIDMTFYPELIDRRWSGGELVKRSIDILGSIVGLILFSPLMTLLPVLIKIGSKGPVFFTQERIGRNGRKFKMLKFRSMYLDNDDVIHREYVKQLIKGENCGADGIFKIRSDPRVTPVGRYLRKYSLDELPQFFNVLKGDMSLVGPRPPIRYEVEHYQGWQRNRLMGKKPGITGLWQITGRSSTSFEEMVRLDLRYLHGWSIRLDLKIILRTPAAMLKAKGAY